MPPKAATKVESQSDEGIDDSLLTLANIPHRKTINFAIRATYTDWKPREAFRELLQNWRDGIIKSFGLPEKDFVVQCEVKKAGASMTIVYTAVRTLPNGHVECMGYIRYSGYNGKGTVELTNRCATLEPWHLDIGGTTKANDDQQAGAHGEGLKLALLVMMRNPQTHAVRCRSGSFNWYFGFSKIGRLTAGLHRIGAQGAAKLDTEAKRMADKGLVPFPVAANRDVQFMIGEEKSENVRDDHGNYTKAKQVLESDFSDWVKAALFLHPARDGTISTPYGDLLLDEQLRGNIYLKGLLLCESSLERSASVTDQPLKFGYNFAAGQTNRERQSLASRWVESEAILAIWNDVIAKKPETVAELSAMLNTKETGRYSSGYADVAGVRTSISFDMAKMLQKHLRAQEPKAKWFYTEEEMARTPRTERIIAGFGCTGVKLTDRYWAALSRHGLLVTAEEEEWLRFATAASATVPESSFATAVNKLLQGAVRGCPQTKDIDVTFVDGGSLDLHVFYAGDKGLFQFHNR